MSIWLGVKQRRSPDSQVLSTPPPASTDSLQSVTLQPISIIPYATPLPKPQDHLEVGHLLDKVSMILAEMSREQRGDGSGLYDHYLRLPQLSATKRREWSGLHWG